jgi:hypothetical protein
VQDFSRTRLFALVRDFSQTAQSWEPAIRMFTRQDEVYSLLRASQRAYGRPEEWMVIQAAAGLDSPEDPMTERELILPTVEKLRQFKRQAGYDDGDIL